MRAILPSLLTTQYPMTTSTKTETAAKKDVTKLQRAIVDGLEDVKAQEFRSSTPSTFRRCSSA